MARQMLQQLRGLLSPSLRRLAGSQARVVRCRDCGQSLPALEDADAILRTNGRFVCGDCHYEAWQRRDPLRNRGRHDSTVVEAS
jgi:ribosomal protein S27AE